MDLKLPKNPGSWLLLPAFVSGLLALRPEIPEATAHDLIAQRTVLNELETNAQALRQEAGIFRGQAARLWSKWRTSARKRSGNVREEIFETEIHRVNGRAGQLTAEADELLMGTRRTAIRWAKLQGRILGPKSDKDGLSALAELGEVRAMLAEIADRLNALDRELGEIERRLGEAYPPFAAVVRQRIPLDYDFDLRYRQELERAKRAPVPPINPPPRPHPSMFNAIRGFF